MITIEFKILFKKNEAFSLKFVSSRNFTILYICKITNNLLALIIKN